jgi:hypothetical protein
MPSAIAAAYLLAALTLQGPARKAQIDPEAPRPDVSSPWTQLTRAEGLVVSVVDVAGTSVTGILLRVEPESLVILVNRMERRFPREAIRRVTSKQKDSVKNGALTGALVGAGMAAMSSCRVDNRKCGTGGRIGFVAFGAGLWAAIGAAIDGSVDKRVKLYEARPTRPD